MLICVRVTVVKTIRVLLIDIKRIPVYLVLLFVATPAEDGLLLFDTCNPPIPLGRGLLLGLYCGG